MESQGLDGALVGSSPDPEEAVLAPVRAPRVLTRPVLLPCGVVHAVAHQQDGVVGDLWEREVVEISDE